MKALVLAGGLPQIKLINELKSRNIEVVLADYFPNPVAKPYADIFYQISTLDVPAISDLAKKENVDFLITVCTDQALLTVAEVSEKLNLPCYIDYQTALNVTNKQYMKEVFSNNNISTAKYKIVEVFDDEIMEDFSFPIIVKPVDCNSSKGVKKVNSPDELKTAFDDAVKISRTKTAIIEEFISGKELSIDVYVEEGCAKILNISELEKLPENDKFVIFRSSCLDNISAQIKDKIQKTAQKIADSFKLRNSPMLIQLISDGIDVFVLEFSARTGGGEKFEVIEKVSGFNVIKAVVDLTLGMYPHVEDREDEQMFISTEFIYCKPGIFNEVKYSGDLLNEKIIDNFYLFKWQGAEFDTVENSGDRIAGFTISGKSKDELDSKHNEVLTRLIIEDINGDNMMRKDLLPPLNW